MKANLTRDEALELLLKYNKDTFHIKHSLTVEQIMKYFAKEFNEDVEFWGIVGLLHDLDYEMYPEEHCVKVIDILNEFNGSDELIHGIISHGYNLVNSIYPEHIMEKVLYSVDELSGLIGAYAVIRPSKSVKDIKLKSLKKKFKDKGFAKGCSRDTILAGADMLEFSIDELLDKTLIAMKNTEDDLRLEFEKLNLN